MNRHTMEQDAVVYIAGQRTLIGAALLRELARQGYRRLAGTGDEPTLTDALAVERFFAKTRPEYVVLAGGPSGGIEANQRFPADLYRENVLLQCHVIDSAYRHGVKKLLYLSSSCSYPRRCPQPMRVESMWTGPLEPTNAAYAVAKLSGVAMCQAYRQQYGVQFLVGIPGDAFGPGDDFHPRNSHVVAALIRRMHEAKLAHAPVVEIWGSGAPRRGFIFVDDLAAACLFVLQRYEGVAPINIAGTWDVSIREMAEAIKEVVGYPGTLRFDTSKPDGIPIKVLETSELQAMGWQVRWTLRDGLAATYRWFLEQAQGSADSRAADLGRPERGGISAPRDVPDAGGGRPVAEHMIPSASGG